VSGRQRKQVNRLDAFARRCHRRVDKVQNALLERLRREQLEMNRRLTLIEEAEASPHDDRVDHQMQLVDESCDELLAHYRDRSRQYDVAVARLVLQRPDAFDEVAGELFRIPPLEGQRSA
jgi:hypothetical protein